jgi:2-polyprenyl-3-methyl-5-hydroxy-6-metoxy-1,4-benzoquinol methylase
MRPRADTLLVWTGAPCGYGCSTCPIDPALASAGLQVGTLHHALAALPATAGRLAVLVGGEPFLRPDLLRLIAVIRAAGCSPGIVTTGRPLVYPELRAKLRRAGLAYLRVQFFGIGAAHDQAAAVPGAFEQAIAGLRAWTAEVGAACDVDVALNIRRRPLETIATEIRDLAGAIASSDVQMIVAVDPAGYTEPGYTESLHRAVTTLAAWNDDAEHPLLAWEGLPASASAASTLRIARLWPEFVASTPGACCLGPVQADESMMAAHREDTRANSFNFVRTTTAVPWTATAEACTAYSQARGLEPSRHLWLIEDDTLVLHATDTGDFTAWEIAQIKDGWSHLFVDRAPAGVLDDFTEGMRRVLPDVVCDACPHRAECPRRFRVVEGPPFGREEAWIASYIAGLRGRVLDVGCGEQLYQNQLAPLVRSGAVRYTGLDPDELSLTRLRTALPQGRFVLGGIEDFHDEPESYDHILCLRSLNHVTDVDEALARMAGLLKPGGTLLVVECTAFAMLRRHEQVAAADQAPRAGHQHFRNVSSEDVLPYARRRALQVVHHHPATLQTTNEWILLLARAPAPAA